MRGFFSFIELLSVCACLWCCSGTSEGDGGIEVIDIGNAAHKPEVVCLSKYANEIRYIQLESSEQCLLGDASRLNIKLLNDIFCIWEDSRGTVLGDPVLCFNSNGDFLNSIGSHGRADNEFLTICNVLTNDEKNIISIVDNTKALVYSHDGIYKYNFDMLHNGICSMSGAWMENNMVVFLKRKNLGASIDELNARTDELVVIDTMGTVLKKFDLGKNIIRTFETDSPFGKGTGVLSKVASLYVCDNSIKIIRNNDLIYDFNVSDWKLNAQYKIDLGKYGLSENMIGAKVLNNNKEVIESERFILMKVIFSPIDFPEYDRNYINSYFIYDKKERTTACLKYNIEDSEANFKNDIDGGINFYPTYIKDGKMYQLVNAIDFIEMAEKSTSAKMKEVAAQLTEDSNPVVVEVTLK